VKVNQQQFGAIVSNLEHRQAHITRLQSQIDVSSNTIRDQVNAQRCRCLLFLATTKVSNVHYGLCLMQ
jgi:hypothetical protein